jgi:hypothetical protein
MRRAAAALLVAVLVALAGAPHHHTVRDGDHDCPACIARGAEEAHGEIPDLAPALARILPVELEPVEAPPAGAPLGAVPGQSPPVNA